MKRLLFYFVFAVFSLTGWRCNFTSKEFSASGSIRYTFDVPKEATKADIVQTLSILQQRIAGYTASKAHLAYNDTLREITAGVPKALAIKGTDACEKILQTKGDFNIVMPFDFRQLEDKTLFIEATAQGWAALKMEGKIEGKIDNDERAFTDFFQFFTNKNLYLGTARAEDTAQVRQVLETEIVQKSIPTKLHWLWQKETDFDWKLCAYVSAINTAEINNSITRTMLKKATLDFDREKNGIFLIELDEVGSAQLTTMTAKAIKEQLPLFVLIDGALICAPQVMETITVGKLTIYNYFSLEELMFYSVVLNIEPLPFLLKAKT